MTNPKAPNTPFPVPETMAELREMARNAMALSLRNAANLDKLETRLTAMGTRLTEVGTQLAEVGTRLTTVGTRLTEVGARLDKTEKLVKEIAIVSGRHNENTGRVLEEEIIAKVEREGKIAWMRADEIYSHLERRIGGRVVGENDIVIGNGGEVMVVEIKRVLRADDVKRFAEADLVKFREHFPGIVGDRAIYGAIAFSLEEKNHSAREKARKAAEHAGLLLIHAVGKTGLELLNPEREKLRAAGGGKENTPH